MPVDWMDVSHLPFESLLLLERVQLGWLPGWLPEEPLAVALRANPLVEWYLRHKNPLLNDWLDDVLARPNEAGEGVVVEDDMVRQAEISVLRQLTDLLVYALDPQVYEEQPFLSYDDKRLRELADFRGKRVVDVGAGTGRLSFVAAETAGVVWAVEPVENLRRFLKEKAAQRGVENLYVVDGLLTEIPFPDDFFDITLGGYVFGDDRQEEYAEAVRVTRLGGLILFWPGNVDEDNETHEFLLAHGFEWGAFEEPPASIRRAYWKRLDGESGS